MWEPRRLTILWAFTACYRDSFTFLPFYFSNPEAITEWPHQNSQTTHIQSVSMLLCHCGRICVKPWPVISDKPILSSERMLHKDNGRKGSVEKKSLVVILKGLRAKTNRSAVNRQSWSNSYFDCDWGSQLYTTDPSSRQRGRPTSTNRKLSDSNKTLVLGHIWGLTPRQTGRLAVGRKVTLTLRASEQTGMASHG
jgi:hypothetical protein